MPCLIARVKRWDDRCNFKTTFRQPTGHECKRIAVSFDGTHKRNFDNNRSSRRQMLLKSFQHFELESFDIDLNKIDILNVSFCKV